MKHIFIVRLLVYFLEWNDSDVTVCCFSHCLLGLPERPCVLLEGLLGVACVDIPLERDEREWGRSWMLMDLPPTGGCVNKDLQKGLHSPSLMVCNQMKWALCEGTEVGGRFLRHQQIKHVLRKTWRMRRSWVMRTDDQRDFFHLNMYSSWVRREISVLEEREGEGKKKERTGGKEEWNEAREGETDRR